MYIVVYSLQLIIRVHVTKYILYILRTKYKKFTQTIFPVDTIQDSQEVF